MAEPVRPADRITALATERMESSQEGRNLLLACWNHPTLTVDDVVAYLNEEQVRRAAFEAAIISRLADLERKTSSTAGVDFSRSVSLATQPPIDLAFAELKKRTQEAGEEAVPMVHVGHRDSLSRYGTGHPSERCCKTCGRPTFDKLDAYRGAAGEPYCSKGCYDLRPMEIGELTPAGQETARLRETTDYVGPGEPKIRTYERDPMEPEQ